MYKKRIFWLAAASALLLSGCTLRIGFGGDDGGASSQPVASSSETAAAPDTSSAQDETSGESTPPAAESSEAAAVSGASSSVPAGEEITADDALSIALELAGVAAEDAYGTQAERDQENGTPVYQVEFETQTAEYDYDIARSDGRMLNFDYELKDSALRGLAEDPTDLDGAREQVVTRTGAPAEEINIWEERDDGRTRYEGNVYSEGVYYEFEIDSETGAVTDWSAEVKE